MPKTQLQFNLIQNIWKNQLLHRHASYNVKKLSYYEILGVDKKCRLEEVKVAFREKSKQLHPDGEKYQVKNDGLSKSHWNYKSNTHSFMELKEAYDTIRNPDKRKEYDSLLFDTESKDGFLMEKGSWNNFITNKNSYGSVETGASQPRVRMRNSGGHFFDPNQDIKLEEKNQKYFKHGMMVVILAIAANILFVSFLKEEKKQRIEKKLVVV